MSIFLSKFEIPPPPHPPPSQNVVLEGFTFFQHPPPFSQNVILEGFTFFFMSIFIFLSTNEGFFFQRPSALAKIVGVYRIGFRNQQTNNAMKQDLLVVENLFYNRNISQVCVTTGTLANATFSSCAKIRICDFRSFSTVFRSYQSDGWMIMKVYAMERLRCRLEGVQRGTTRLVCQRLIHRATGVSTKVRHFVVKVKISHSPAALRQKGYESHYIIGIAYERLSPLISLAYIYP